jgi:hypothetical protein
MESSQKYVVDVQVIVKDGENRFLSKALSVQLTFPDSIDGSVDGYDQVEEFPYTYDKEKRLICFIKKTTDSDKLKNAVSVFMEKLKSDLEDESKRSVWHELLDTDDLPIIDSFQIFFVRPFPWKSVVVEEKQTIPE